MKEPLYDSYVYKSKCKYKICGAENYLLPDSATSPKYRSQSQLILSTYKVI